MSIPYPNKPWSNGETFEYTTAQGVEVIGTYDLSKNAWSFTQYDQGPPAEIDPSDIFTTTVKTVGIPFTKSPKNLNNLDNQYDVNWYLADEISQNKAKIDFLELTIFGFSNISIGPLPPNNPDLFNFWFDSSSNEFYYWDSTNDVWVIMDFGGGRKPIFSPTEPTEHPDFVPPDDALVENDLWFDTNNPTNILLFVWNGSAWIPTDDLDRPPIVSSTKPIEHPKFPGDPLELGDIWLDNSDSGRMSMFVWNPDVNNWVPVGPASRPPIFSPTEPTEHPDFPAPDNQLIAGDEWVDNTDPLDTVEYIYDGTQWIKIGGEYVHRKGGDSMEGPLQVTGPRAADPTTGKHGTVKVLSVDSGQNSSLHLKHNGNTRAYVGDQEFTIVGNLKFNTGGKSIYTGNDKKGFTVNDNGVFYEGNYTNDRHVATKKTVEDAINAATKDKEGHFTWDASSTDLPIGAWQFEGRSTPSYEEPGVQIINVQKVDNDGQSFDPTDFVVGGQIEILNQNNSDHLAGAITNVVDGGPKSIQITFTRTRAQGQATGDQIIKTIVDTSAPYVNIAGDTMVGDLTMKDAKIKFDTDSLNKSYIDFTRPNGEYITAVNLSHNNDVASQEGGYEVHLGGFTSYNRLRLTGRNSTSDPNMFEARADGAMTFLKDVSYDSNQIKDLGDATDDTDAVPYGQVKRELQDKFDEYVDTISFGTYTYTISMSPNNGFFAAYSGGGTSHIPSQIDELWIAKRNTTGDDVGLDSLAPGDLIRWAQGTDLYQFRVNGTPSDKGNFYEIQVNKGVGPGNLTVSTDFNISLIKLTGGSVDLDEYVKKAGDTMTGTLEINRTADNDEEATLLLKGKRPSTDNPVATIQFQNNTNQTIGYLRYSAYGTDGSFKFNKDVEFNNKKLLNVNQIDFTSPGILKVNGLDALNMRRAANGNDGNANFQVPRAPNTRRTFAIRGKDEAGDERDLLYCYSNITGGDAINYHGIQTGDDHIATVGKIKQLIAGGGDDNAEIIQRHGPYHFAGVSSSVNPGQFSTDVGPLKQIRQITFHRKNNNNEDDYWSDLAPGEVFTVGQSDGANYFIVNYTVKELQQFSAATIIDVDATQTVVAYSNGDTIFNPSDAFGFINNTDTFVLESQPATLNGASVLARKATPAPAYYSYKLSSSSSEPFLGVSEGNFIASGPNINNPSTFIFSTVDRLGNGIKSGANTVDCPGSVVELYRANGDGTNVLCKAYTFNKFVSRSNNQKYELLGLVQTFSATSTNSYFPNPGTLEGNAEYLVNWQINFSTSAFIIDEEGDPHFEDHRLEDVGAPVAATDAATKGYVDQSILTLPSAGPTMHPYRYTEKGYEELGPGEFSAWGNSQHQPELANMTSIYIKGVDANGVRPVRDDTGILWEGKLASALVMLNADATRTYMRHQPLQGSNQHITLAYDPDADIYSFFWTSTNKTTPTSTFTKLTKSQVVNFYCPDLFF